MFDASVGWFDRFKSRLQLRYVKIESEAASAVQDAAYV
jgi:hypothetical protein